MQKWRVHAGSATQESLSLSLRDQGPRALFEMPIASGGAPPRAASDGSWWFVKIRPFSIFGSRHCCKELLPVPDHFCHYFESLTTTYHTTGHQSPAALPGLPELWILWRSLLSAEKKCGCSLAPPTTMIVMSLWKFVGRWNSVALFLDSWEQVWQHPWIHVCLIMILGCTVLYDFGFGGNSFHWKFELGGSAWLEIACFSLSGCKLSRCGCKLIRWSFLEVPCGAPAPSWNSLLEFKGFAGFHLSAEKFPRWSFWVGRLSSSPRLTWVEFRGWKFFAFLSLECRLLRWSFVDGSSLRLSFPEFLSWNLTKLLASLFLQRNFVGGVFWVGHPGWQFFPFLCFGNQIPGGIFWVGHPGSLAST